MPIPEDSTDPNFGSSGCDTVVPSGPTAALSPVKRRGSPRGTQTRVQKRGKRSQNIVNSGAVSRAYGSGALSLVDPRTSGPAGNHASSFANGMYGAGYNGPNSVQPAVPSFPPPLQPGFGPFHQSRMGFSPEQIGGMSAYQHIDPQSTTGFSPERIGDVSAYQRVDFQAGPSPYNHVEQLPSAQAFLGNLHGGWDHSRSSGAQQNGNVHLGEQGNGQMVGGEAIIPPYNPQSFQEVGAPSSLQRQGLITDRAAESQLPGRPQNCKCGPNCKCFACATHPFNVTTRERTADLLQIMLKDGLQDLDNSYPSYPQTNEGFPSTMGTICPDSTTDSTSAQNGQEMYPAVLPPLEQGQLYGMPISNEGFPSTLGTSGLATTGLQNGQGTYKTGLPSLEQSRLFGMPMPNGYGTYGIPIGTSGSCICDENCVCPGCPIHDNRVSGPSLAESQYIAHPSETQNVAYPLEAYPSKPQSMAYPAASQNMAYPSGSQNVAHPADTQNMAYPSQPQDMPYPVDLQNLAYITQSLDMAYPADSQNLAYLQGGYANGHV